MVKEILDRGANVQARSMLRELNAVYEYSIALDRFPDDFANPALPARGTLRQSRVRLTPQKGKRVLSDNELKAVLAWLPGSGFSATQKNVFFLTLWTACRTGEVCQAEWRDMDLDKGTWQPARVQKQRRPIGSALPSGRGLPPPAPGQRHPLIWICSSR